MTLKPSKKLFQAGEVFFDESHESPLNNIDKFFSVVYFACDGHVWNQEIKHGSVDIYILAHNWKTRQKRIVYELLLIWVVEVKECI